MFAVLVSVAIFALVTGADVSTTNDPTHAHHTHNPHHTQPPTVEHTVDVSEAVFFQDLPNKVMILKTVSGCYVHHLNDHQLESIKDIEKLLHLETSFIHQIRHAEHFNLVSHKYSTAIQDACPKVYGHHHN